jgi:hypothetical protein
MGVTEKYNDLNSGYLNDRITIGIPEYGYCIYADYNDKEFNGVLDFKSQTTGWNEEKFYKTGPPKDFSEAEFLTQYNSFDPNRYKFEHEIGAAPNDKTNAITEKKESREIKVGGILLQVPGYVSEGKISNGGASYEYKNDNVGITIDSEKWDKDVTDEMFVQYGKNGIESYLNTLSEDERDIISSDSFELLHSKSKIPYYYVEIGKENYSGAVVIMNNYKENCALTIIFVCDDVNKLTDFRKMIYEVKRISDQADIKDDIDEENKDEDDIKEIDPNGVDPELKAFLDSYEAFMDEYVEFMQKYKSGGSSLDMMSDYLDMLSRYQDFAEKAEKYDTDKMSDADSKYYLEVMTRINAKILQVAY